MATDEEIEGVNSQVKERSRVVESVEIRFAIQVCVHKIRHDSSCSLITEAPIGDGEPSEFFILWVH